MNVLRKVLAVLAIILAVVFLIVSLAGIGGVWVVRARVNTAITNLFDLSDRSIVRLSSGIEEVITLSGDVGGAASEMDAAVQTLGAKIEETPVILLAVDALLDGKLIPGLEKFNKASQNFYTGLVQLQAITNSLNTSFLFSRRDGALDKIDQFLVDFIATLEQLDQNASDLKSGVQDTKAETTDKIIGRLTKPLEQISTLMSNTQTRLYELNSNLSDLQDQLNAAEANLIRLITLVVFLVSLIFLWIAFSQAIVIRWALGYYKTKLPATASPETLPEGTSVQPDSTMSNPLPAESDMPSVGDPDQDLDLSKEN